MGTVSVNLGTAQLQQVANNVNNAAAALTSAASVLQNPTSLLGSTGFSVLGQGAGGMWPLKVQGPPTIQPFMGIPTLETFYHESLEQGRHYQKSIGDAMAHLRKEQYELNQKILHWLGLNRTSTNSQLKLKPRTIKLVADCVKIMKEVQTCIQQIQGCTTALTANIAMVNAMEAQMVGMIQQELTFLANLLAQICNWRLPSLPSLAFLNSFRFNNITGFSFSGNLHFNTNFNFNQCNPFAQNSQALAALFSNAPTTGSFGPLPIVSAQPSIPGANLTVDPSQYTDPTVIATMQATSTLVMDPLRPPTLGSLPNPGAIISNYALSPAQYQANVVSTVSALEAAVTSSGEALQPLLAQYVTLEQVVASNYDPNLTAAWLFYLNLNITGRAGQWLPSFAAAYTALIQPSVLYLKSADVPWNTVLGGSGTVSAPTAIPLIATLKADTTNHLLWQLSFVEAALLGYDRATLWDSAADNTYLGSFTGSALDYIATSINLASTATVTLGSGTAAYPVVCTYPTAIASTLAAVIALATISIFDTPNYQSTRPQFRYTYDQFANAALVDRFSQFWRVFNANLVTLLQEDPYVVSFVASYVDTLNGALNPLADVTDYATVIQDASSRSRTWTPGSDLLNVPPALVTNVNNTVPADTGWQNGTFTASTFLLRPDIQALPLTTQYAMLRMNQSYAAIVTMQNNLSNTVANAVAAATASIQASVQPGWQVETNTTITIPPGSGLLLPFMKTDFDQTGYVDNPQTIRIQTAGDYALMGDFEWDTTGEPGTRTATLLLNNEPLLTAAAESNSSSPFAVQFSTAAALAQGDTLQIQLSHNLTSPQNLLTGSSFMGLVDSSSSPQDLAPVVNTAATKTFIADATLSTLMAVSIQPDGGVLPVNPVYPSSAAPFVDGITTAAAVLGASVDIATNYGSVSLVPGATFTVGGLLYVGSSGVLTQDFSSISGGGYWIICVGKAVTTDSFIYEPQIPQHS